MIYALDISEVLLLSEAVRSNLKTASVSEQLDFTESVSSQHKFISIDEKINFNETVVGGKSVQKNISESLSLAESIYPHVYEVDVNEILTLSELLTRSVINEQLVFTEAVSVDVVRVASDLITLTESLTLTVTKNLNINESLIFTEGVKGYTFDTCTPSLQINNHQVVYDCNGDIITLPAPDFGNVEGMEFNRVNRRTRGGDLIIYRDPTWPKSKTFNYKWTALKKETREQVIQFSRRNIGKLMTMNNYEGNLFTGIIRGPETKFTEDRRDLHSVEILFEVE